MFHAISTILIGATLVCSTPTSKFLQFEATEVGKLPNRQFASAAVYDGGDSIFILGGQSGNDYLDQVLRFDITSNEVSKVAKFPEGIAYGSASRDRFGDIYFFPGETTPNAVSKNVWKITSLNHIPTKVVVNNNTFIYSWSRRGSCSAAGSDQIYVIGGSDLEGENPYIVPYTDIFNTTEMYIHEIRSYLPIGIMKPAVACHGVAAYAFGGVTHAHKTSNDVLKVEYSDFEETAFALGVKLESIDYPSAVTVGDIIYVIGGKENSEEPANIARFNVLQQSVEYYAVNSFPETLSLASSVYIPKNKKIYVFGGISPDGPSEKIYSIQL